MNQNLHALPSDLAPLQGEAGPSPGPFPSRKDLLRKAIRAVRFLNQDVLNKTVTQINACTEEVDNETALLKEELEARMKLVPLESGFARTVRDLISCSQPLKALEVLAQRPVGLEDAPHLNALQVRLESALVHAFSFDEFRRRYAVPIYLSTHSLRGNPRANLLADTVRQARPKRMLAIGGNDFAIERDALDAVPEMTMTVAELSTSADSVVADLMLDYPGRVRRHEMTDFYDWAPEGEQFDLVVMFEVLEHLPDPEAAAKRLFDLCDEKGIVLLSVPSGIKYAADDSLIDSAWFSHLHAFTSASLGSLLRSWFKDVAVGEATDKTLLAACQGPLG